MSTNKTEGAKIFAIGDIHGCNDELQLLLKKLPTEPNSIIVFLGDYIDRGVYSKQVVDTILHLKKVFKVVCLMGNHEAMLLEFLEDPGSPEAGRFIYNGGSATLASYSIEPGKFEIPDSHLKFFKELELSYETEDFFFVHAGVPDISLKEIDKEKHKIDMLWIREKFFTSDFKWEKTIVHGHTPVPEVELLPHRINVDTGCVYSQKLTAIELPSKILYEVEKQDEAKHTFLEDTSKGRVASRFRGKLTIHINKEEQTYDFNSINYSEFGMLIMDIKHDNDYILSPHETVEGLIRLPGSSVLRFSGEVVRIEKADAGIMYGIKFLNPIGSLT